MAYDYTTEWLQRHAGLAQTLIQLADTNSISEMDFGTAREMVRARLVINNCLASLAINNKTYEGIRNKVRTWAKYLNDERWHLYVGVPPADLVLRGARSKELPVMLGAPKAYIQAVESGEVQYEHLIESGADMAKLLSFVQLRYQNKAISAIRIELASEVTEGAVEYFQEVFSLWLVESAGPSTIIMRRPT